MDKKIKNDFIAFLAFAVFGLILLITIPSLIPGKSGFQIDSRLFPRVVAALFVVVGGVSAAFTWRKGKKLTAAEKESVVSEETEELPESGSKIRVVGMTIVMIAYALLIEPIGFIPTTFLAVTAILLLEKVRKISYYLAVYAACAVLYGIFRYVLLVQL